MATASLLVTNLCEIVNVAVDAPPANLIVAGTDATLGSVLVRVIVSPAAGAGPLKVTVPVTVVCEPPTTTPGFNPRLWTALAVMESVVVWTLVPDVAVTVTVVPLLTALVATGNVAVAAPLGMVTLAGTVAVEPLELSLTVTPEGGAKPDKLTVPTEATPPITGLGAIETLARDAGVIDKVAVLVVPLSDAVIVDVTLVDCPDV